MELSCSECSCYALWEYKPPVLNSLCISRFLNTTIHIIPIDCLSTQQKQNLWDASLWDGIITRLILRRSRHSMIRIFQVIPGMEAAVKSMRVGGLRRVIIPPSQGYQNTSQEPVPPNVIPLISIFFVRFIVIFKMASWLVYTWVWLD